MISYAPLWETIKRTDATTYTLRVKGNVSNSTILRMKAGDSISTDTLNKLCKILKCDLVDVIAYIPDK